MTGRRVVFGLCLLCALAFGALAAQSAGATTKGTTAFTCVQDAGGALKGAHCLTSGSGAAYKHVSVPENTQTEVKGTNANTASETTAASTLAFKVTVAGTPFEVRATGVQGTGLTENRKTASGEHYVEDSGTLTFTGVTAAQPAGKCKIYADNGGVEGEEGVVKTAPLKVTTEGQGDFFKFEPAEGTTLATFWSTCVAGTPEFCEGTWTITGSMKAAASGTTVTFSHVETTTQGTLKGKGSKGGFEGAITISAKDPLAGDKEFTPLSVTTVETP